jgi:phytoene dehydrogenase-like protein
VDETFEHPAVRTFFASGALHAGLAPDDPLGGFFAWMFFSAVQDVGCGLVKGGMQCFADALSSALRAHGGEVRIDSEVTHIVLRNGQAVGVSLRNGEQVDVDGPIASNVDPRHLVLDLIGAEIGADIMEDIRRYEWGPSFLGIYAALERPIAYKAGAELSKACYVHASASSVDDLAQSFADISPLPIQSCHFAHGFGSASAGMIPYSVI